MYNKYNKYNKSLGNLVDFIRWRFVIQSFDLETCYTCYIFNFGAIRFFRWRLVIQNFVLETCYTCYIFDLVQFTSLARLGRSLIRAECVQSLVWLFKEIISPLRPGNAFHLSGCLG